MNVTWRRFAPLLCAMTAIIALTHAETHLIGDISAITFTSSSGPFIVEQEIKVPQHKRVVIGPGCIFLFKPFTTLTIAGSFIAQGTPEQPILFTSITDTVYTKGGIPNAFDWNGISVAPEAEEARFDDCNISYSNYGIESSTEIVTIHHCTFRQNGQRSFSINDHLMPVIEGNPYGYKDFDTPKNASRTRIESVRVPTTLHVQSDPPGAEVLFGTLSPRAFARGRTPLVLRMDDSVKTKKISVLLRGFMDTAFTAAIEPSKATEVFVHLDRVVQAGVASQNRFYQRRSKFRWSIAAGGASVPGLISSIVLLVKSNADYGAGAAAKKWCDAAAIKSGPDYDAHLRENQSKIRSGDAFLTGGLVCGGISVLLIATTVALQF